MHFLSGYQVLISKKGSCLSKWKRRTELPQSQICVSVSFKVAQFLMPVCLYEHKTEVIMHLQNFKDATVSHKKVTEFKWLIIQGQGVKFIQAMNKQF